MLLPVFQAFLVSIRNGRKKEQWLLLKWYRLLMFFVEVPGQLQQFYLLNLKLPVADWLRNVQLPHPQRHRDHLYLNLLYAFPVRTEFWPHPLNG